MFTTKVAILPLEMTGLRFLNTEHYYDWLTPKREIDPTFLVEDVLLQLEKPDWNSPDYNHALPDFWIRGTFNYGKWNKFPYITLDPRGLHTLYITGIPRDLDPYSSMKFRVQDLSYLYYWEDSHYGYLTQIIKNIP